MNKTEIEDILGKNSLFSGKIELLDTVPSTNTRLKELALSGAPEGTVLLAQEQTAGRGTSSRSFFSPRGEGLYLSVLLRPSCSPEQLLTLTGRTSVAVRAAMETASGAPCAIKWLNDIYLGERKLCGILTEFSLSPTPWVIVGVGVNVSQTAQTFAAQGLGNIATSLAAEGYAVSREQLAAAILSELEAMYRTFPQGLASTVEEYRSRCITVGRRVSFTQNGQAQTGLAVSVDDAFALTVETAHGQYTVNSGTVSLL